MNAQLYAGNVKQQNRPGPKPTEKRIANGQKVMIHTTSRHPDASKLGPERLLQRASKPNPQRAATKPAEPSKHIRTIFTYDYS